MRSSGVVALGIAGALAGACASAPRPKPGTASAATIATAAPPRDTIARHGYTAADVRFMQQMIHHHAQALRMAALVPTRSGRDDIRILAERIDASQQAEIEAMRHWLEERHEVAPGPAMHHMAAAADSGDMSGMLMPGMLTPAQMAALAAARGAAFDRLFLEGMIRHHEGALTMVAELLATSGGGEEPQLFGFASDVDSGQRAEIRRMQGILATLPDSVPSR